MSHLNPTIAGEDVVVCFLKRYSKGKAIPRSADIKPSFESYHHNWNHLNMLDLPGQPAVYWISRGYEVFSSLTDDQHWMQVCISDKPKDQKLKDLEIYTSKFIPEIEHSMCDEPTCHAYMTFDDCEHTLPENLHYLLVDYL